jgi:hypothetical protein
MYAASTISRLPDFLWGKRLCICKNLLRRGNRIGIYVTSLGSVHMYAFPDCITESKLVLQSSLSFIHVSTANYDAL